MVFSQFLQSVKMSGKMRQYKKGVRTKLTPNFYSTEFDCRCKDPECQWTIIDLEHVEKLQEKRNKWRKSIKITSGYRCPKYNKLIGGATNSQHPKGTATDIQVSGMTPDKVADDCEDFKGLGRYNSFTHTDSRSWDKPARWDFRK